MSRDAFTVAGALQARDTLTLGASLEAQLRRNLSVQVDYNADMLASGERQQWLAAGVRWVW